MRDETQKKQNETESVRVAGRGLWIAFEGMDGCGKSTASAAVGQRLDAVMTREPGATALGQQIRQALLHGESAVSERAEVMLFAADRAQHIDEVVRPALEAGKWVVSDRSLWSSVAYQGSGRGLGAETVAEISYWASDGVVPDIVVLLDIDRETSVKRLGGQADRLEREGAEFFERTAEGFRRAAAEKGWIVIDGRLDPATVVGTIMAELEALGVAA